MNSGRIAVVGAAASAAQDVLAALRAAGFQARAFAGPADLRGTKTVWDGIVALAAGSGAQNFAAVRQAAGSVPVLVVAERIDLEIVREAASLGAHDVVLRSDLRAVADSVARSLGEAAAQAPAHLPAPVRAELTRRLFDLTPNYVSIRDGQGRFVMVSQSLADLHGTTVEEMAGKPVSAFAAGDAAVQADAEEDAGVLRLRRSNVSLTNMVDAAGTPRVLQVIKRPITLEDGTAYVLCVAIDVTAGRRTESTLEKTNDFLSNVLETISDAVFALDLSGKFTLANRRLSQLTGYKPDRLVGMPFVGIFASESLHEVRRMLAGALGDATKERRFEAHIAHAAGHQRIVTCSLTPLRQGDRLGGIVGTAVDITEKKSAEAKVEYLAYHDPLTNLPNRRLLNDRLTMAMSQAQRDGRFVAVMFADLDRFKSINDSLGHRTGDHVLQELGKRLSGCLRAGDTVARLGGDEFVFLLPAVDRIEDTFAVARSVLDAVRRPLYVEGREFVVTACVGISVYPNHASDADTLIKQADTALFEAKRRSSDTYELFDESMSARSLDHFLLENELRRAIAQRELALVYQPIVEMRTERVIAVEALVRWHHPERGVLLPDDFIGLAEETGLIVPLGDWVVREACRQNRDWQRRGIFMVPVAVNISGRQCDEGLLATISEALDESALPAHYLDVELTESILMQSAAASSVTIEALKALGTRISIDDFGTGYSSLSYLQRFSVDALKIDRSFMPIAPEEPGAGIIASTIISMAQSLGIGVIAEGVETQEQRDFLLARGCSRAQGHYFWPALPAQELERALFGANARDGVLAQDAL